MDFPEPTSWSDDPNPSNITAFRPSSDAAIDRANYAQANMTCDDLPAGFVVRPDGIYQLRPSDGGETFERICSSITVLGFCRDSDGRGWGRVVEVQDLDGNWHQHLVDESKFGDRPETVLRPLRDLGLDVATFDKAAQSVVQLLREWRPSRRFNRIRACGWTDDSCRAFVQATGQVIGDDQVVLSSGMADSVGAAVRETGSLEMWREAISELCIGNSLMSLCVCHALTGPLLRLAGMEGGGFHLSGPSSKGKTTLQKIAASVWGGPSFLQSWRATDNGIEGLAVACNDGFLALNELAEVDPSKLGNIVYLLGNGQGKIRARQDGSLGRSTRWRVSLLSSGEVSVEAHMATAGKQIHAGQSVRLIHVAVDRGPNGAFASLHGMENAGVFAEHLETMVGTYHGSAGPAFVRILIERRVTRNFINRLLKRLCDETIKKLDIPADGEIRRVLRRYMLAAVAGEIAAKFGITGWPRGTALNAARSEFRRWLLDRDTATYSEISDAIVRTRAFLDAHSHRFPDMGPLSATGQPGWKDENFFYVRSDTWSVIHNGANPQEAARRHQEVGLLRTNNRPGLQYKMPRCVGRELVYAVSANVVTWEPPK